jgi:NAD(P)H dehydrogenase (quinone)
MRVLLLDGHPDEGRYSSHLLDEYRSALPADCDVTAVALRDLAFNPNLAHGYRKRTTWEPDLMQLAEALDACDHLVIAFPMWWGAEPAMLKGLLDRLFLPGFTFAYHDQDTFWDRHMAGRSADVIITMDTPPFFLWLAYGNAIIRRWKGQVLGFAGFKPVRILPLGQVKFGGAEKNAAKWTGKVRRMAQTIRQAEPGKKEPRLAAFLGREPTP